MHNKPALNKQDSLERLFKLSCFAVICCGFISCLLLLFTTGLIEDEIFSILVSNPHTSYLSLFKDFYIKDVTPPLYLSLLYLYNHLGYFINSALWFRLPSFIFWFLSAGAVWFYLPKAAGQKVRLIFISFFFLSPSLIFILTEARTYGFSVFLGTVFICAALNMAYALCLKRDLRLKDKTVFFICGLLLCFAHYFGAVFFVCTSAALIIYAFALKRDVKIFVCGLFIITALLMLWLVPNYAALKQAGVFDGNWWSEKDPLWYGLTDFLILFTALTTRFARLLFCLQPAFGSLKKRRIKLKF